MYCVSCGTILAGVLLAMRVFLEVFLQVAFEWGGITSDFSPLPTVPDSDAYVTRVLLLTRWLLGLRFRSAGGGSTVIGFRSSAHTRNSGAAQYRTRGDAGGG